MPRQKKDEKSLAPKKQSNLERIERISVIIAALLGAFSFFWQVSIFISSQQEKVKLVVWCHVNEYSAVTPQLSVDVINISERPIYIKNFEFFVAFPETPNQLTAEVPYTSPTIGSIYPDLDLIDVGASREYAILWPVEQLARYKSVYLAVDSATKEIQRTEDLAAPINYFTKRLSPIGADTQIKYQCNMP